MDGVGSAAESLTRTSPVGGATKTVAERDEHRGYLAKIAESDPDPGVRRIATRLLKELDDGPESITKSAKSRTRNGFDVYLTQLTERHPDPAMRLRAQDQLDRIEAAR